MPLVVLLTSSIALGSGSNEELLIATCACEESSLEMMSSKVIAMGTTRMIFSLVVKSTVLVSRIYYRINEMKKECF